MLRTIGKIIKLTFYALVILAGVTFAVSNRGKVDLTFFPLPYVLSMQLWLFTVIIFTLGLAMGWFISRFHVLGHWRAHKQAAKRVVALENELGAMHAERSIIHPAAAALPPK
jgi:uncharacterized membrane protein YciS (DUF1049 family)